MRLLPFVNLGKVTEFNDQPSPTGFVIDDAFRCPDFLFTALRRWGCYSHLLFHWLNHLWPCLHSSTVGLLWQKSFEILMRNGYGLFRCALMKAQWQVMCLCISDNLHLHYYMVSVLCHQRRDQRNRVRRRNQILSNCQDKAGDWPCHEPYFLKQHTLELALK